MAREVRIGSRWVGDGHPCLIVAEGGLNHDGQVGKAEALIEQAAHAGADAIKFQRRHVDRLLAPEALETPYRGPHAYGDTYGAHRRALELPDEAWPRLQGLAESVGLLFFASAWDGPSVDFLDALGVPCHKLPSACLTDLLLVDYAAQKWHKPLILSTGMSTMEEVEMAVGIAECHEIVRHFGGLVLLQCCSAYPSVPDDLNLRVISTYRDQFGWPVGYSGHELGLVPSLAAVALGACLVERHFTLDRTAKGPDHRASLEPHDFKRLVEGIREIEVALGDGIKRCLPSEEPARRKLAKSVVLRVGVPRKHILMPGDLEAKGPGTGLPAGHLAQAVGFAVREPLAPGTVLRGALLKRRQFWRRAARVPVIFMAHYRLLRRLNRRPVAFRAAVGLTWQATRPRRDQAST